MTISYQSKDLSNSIATAIVNNSEKTLTVVLDGVQYAPMTMSGEDEYFPLEVEGEDMSLDVKLQYDEDDGSKSVTIFGVIQFKKGGEFTTDIENELYAEVTEIGTPSR